MEWDKWPIKKRSLKLNVTKIIAVLLTNSFQSRAVLDSHAFHLSVPLSTYMKSVPFN